MAEITVEDFKKHARLADSSGVHDDLIARCIAAAEQFVINNTHCSRSELADETGAWPELLQQVVLMLAANYYANSEPTAPVQMREIPYSLTAILDQYRKFPLASADEDDEGEEEEEQP